jgi:hypothetical protein
LLPVVFKRRFVSICLSSGTVLPAMSSRETRSEMHSASISAYARILSRCIFAVCYHGSVLAQFALLVECASRIVKARTRLSLWHQNAGVAYSQAKLDKSRHWCMSSVWNAPGHDGGRCDFGDAGSPNGVESGSEHLARVVRLVLKNALVAPVPTQVARRLITARARHGLLRRESGFKHELGIVVDFPDLHPAVHHLRCCLTWAIRWEAAVSRASVTPSRPKASGGARLVASNGVHAS